MHVGIGGARETKSTSTACARAHTPRARTCGSLGRPGRESNPATGPPESRAARRLARCTRARGHRDTAALRAAPAACCLRRVDKRAGTRARESAHAGARGPGPARAQAEVQQMSAQAPEPGRGPVRARGRGPRAAPRAGFHPGRWGRVAGGACSRARAPRVAMARRPEAISLPSAWQLPREHGDGQPHDLARAPHQDHLRGWETLGFVTGAALVGWRRTARAIVLLSRRLYPCTPTEFRGGKVVVAAEAQFWGLWAATTLNVEICACQLADRCFSGSRGQLHTLTRAKTKAHRGLPCGQLRPVVCRTATSRSAERPFI